MNIKNVKDSYPFVHPYPDIPVEHFLNTPEGPELEVSFSELKELATSTSEKWKEEGFENTRSYLDLEGNLVLIASDASTNRRFLVDGNIIDVSIPPYLQSKDVQSNLTMGKRRLYFNKQNVFDTRHTEPRDIPPQLQPLIERFGPVLYEDEVEPGKWLLDNENPKDAFAYALDIIEQEVKQKNAEIYEFDRHRAYLTEHYAQEAMQLVPEPRFRAAKKAAETDKKREQAYRDELNRQRTLPDDIYKRTKIDNLRK